MGKPVVKKKVVHHTRAERLALTRKKRKEGPAACKRAKLRETKQAAYALAHPPSSEQPVGEATDVGPELLHTPTLAELEDVFRPADEALCAEQQACDRESWANGDRPSREVPS